MSFIDTCRDLIARDSTPSRGNKEAAEYVGGLLQSDGFDVEYQTEVLSGLEQCNVIARVPGADEGPALMLETHLDTVEPGHFSHWNRTQSNPFNASIYNDEIYGLGTADCKLDFLCKKEAAREFLGRPLKRPFVLVATYGAQNAMSGAIKLVRKKRVAAKWAVVGAPTDRGLVVAGQGIAVVSIFIPFSEEEKQYRQNHDLAETSSSQSRLFSGRAAHSSNPDHGDNAILKMLKYLCQLPDGIAVMDLDGGVNYNSVPASAVLEIDVTGEFREPIVPKIAHIHEALMVLKQELSSFKDDRFDPPHATMNLGMIRTEEAGVHLLGSCRLPPSITDQNYEGWMAQLKSACDAVGATFRVTDYRKGFETATGSELVRVAQETLGDLHLPNELLAMTGSCEASVFSRLGMECVVWGPGLSVGNSHAPNEKVKLQDLNKAVDFYKRLIERFCF